MHSGCPSIPPLSTFSPCPLYRNHTKNLKSIISLRWYCVSEWLCIMPQFTHLQYSKRSIYASIDTENLTTRSVTYLTLSLPLHIKFTNKCIHYIKRIPFMEFYPNGHNGCPLHSQQLLLSHMVSLGQLIVMKDSLTCTKSHHMHYAVKLIV